MKKTWIVMMSICAALVFAGCGKKAASPETSAPVPTETSAEESAAPAASLDAPGETEEFKIYTGKVTAVSDTMEDMTLDKNGTEIKFDLLSADVETTFALEPDTEVSVVYKGEISGTDTSNAKVILVLDAQDTMEVKTEVGSVEDQAMSSFTIKLEDGSQKSFLKDNCEGLSSGVLGQATGDSNGSGAMVKVTYITVSYDAGAEADFPLKVEAAE